MAVELTLELTLNCHSVLPVSASRARNSPFSLQVNISPPSVASIPAALGLSVSGASHFFSPVTGLTATKAPTTSPGLNVGLRRRPRWTRYRELADSTLRASGCAG